MGQAGYGTDQEYLALIHEGLSWKPEITLLLFTIENDVHNNSLAVGSSGNAPKPKFELINGNLAQTVYPVQRGFALRRVCDRINLFSLIRRYLALRQIKNLPYQLAVGSGLDSTHAQIAGEGKNHPAFGRPFTVFEEPRPPEVQAAWEVTLALMKAMNDSCRKAGSDFAVYAFGQPPQTSQQSNMIKPFEELKAFAQSEGFDYINEAEDIRRGFEIGGSLRFKTDRHFSAEGHKAAAEIMAKFIESP